MQIKIPAVLRITNPLWVEKLEERNTWEEINETCIIKGKTLDISEYSCCIVGEALNLLEVNYDDFCKENYGKSTDASYHRGCIKCYDYSMALHTDIQALDGYEDHHDLEDSDIKDLEVLLEKFANHLENTHPEYIEEAKIRNAN